MSSEIKEHPILFNGEMVRAILDGRKTQTRRVIKCDHRTLGIVQDDDGVWWAKIPEGDEGGQTGWEYDRIKQPPRPGDRLWVREAFADVRGMGFDYGSTDRPMSFSYRADHDADARRIAEEYGVKWKPSIHMPRWACRLLLEVVSVRAERVQSLSDNDALAEGVEMVRGPRSPEYGVPGLAPTFKHYLNPEFNRGEGVGVRHSFQTLWDSINAGRGFGWDANPWVWAVEFKAIGGGDG